MVQPGHGSARNALDSAAGTSHGVRVIQTEVRTPDTLRVVVVAALSLIIFLAMILALAGLRGGDGASPRPIARAGVAEARPLRLEPVGLPAPPPPMAFVDLPVDAALASNAALPVSPEPIVPAHAFDYRGAPDDRAKALTCLAAAVLYEAGDDPAGEKAVAQVVLNRVRHPAFPKTVCGVIFQGSDRPTGCQFTFTCDGALARPPQPAAWRRAKEIAAAALSGAVDPVVGTATHYHTDWVVPYWRDSLVKLAKVHSQIFYRWSGWWGTRAAFAGTLQPAEPLDTTIAALLQGDAPPVAPSAVPPPAMVATVQRDQDAGLAVLGVPPAALRGNVVRAIDRSRAEFVLQLDPAAYPGSYALTSLALCGTADRCRVMGWLPDADVPTALPVRAETLRTASFVYTRLRAQGVEQAQWDCGRLKRDNGAQCLPGTGGKTTAAASSGPAAH